MKAPLLDKKKGVVVTDQFEFGADEWHNPTFESNRNLALFTGLIITLFFVPICSAGAYAWLFTEETYFIHGSSVIFSGNLTEWKASDPSTRQELDRMEGLDLPNRLASPDLYGYWPNIFQFMFFSVFLDFPTTVQQVYQGFVGTCLADLNYAFMLWMFAHGGECVPDITNKMFALKTPCKEGTYESPGYGKWGYILAILDVNVGMIFVFFLNIGLPVKKWCMSYSALFMMSYMSSAKTDMSHGVMITTLIGSVLAILALCSRRLLPQVALAFNKKYEKYEKDWKVVTESAWEVTETNWGPETISKQVTQIMRYSTEFFNPTTKYGDQQRRAYAMKVQELIEDMNDACDTMNNNLSASWWECFNIGKTGALREQMKHFANTFQFDDRFGKAGGFEEMCHIVQEAVASYERESRESTTSAQKLGLSPELWEQMNECQKETSSMLRCIARRSVSVKEKHRKLLDEKIDTSRDNLEKARDNLVQSAVHAQTSTNRCAAAMIYALNYYASEVKKYSKCKSGDAWQKNTTCEIIKDGIQFATDGTLSCLWIARDYEKEKKVHGEEGARCHGVHYKFERDAFKDACHWNASNAFVIGAAFWMGYWFQGGMFVGYSNYLASSLAVLLGTQGMGSSFAKNLQRLLGVVLGKAIGLLAITCVAIAGCQGMGSLVFHLVVIFTFMSYFSYIYYEGGQWSFVSCLIVGFGCYTLGGYDLCSLWGNDIFSQRYMEIGQLTFAIVFRMAFDSLVTVVPRDEVVKEMQRLCWNFGFGNGAEPDAANRRKKKPLILEAFGKLIDKSTHHEYDDLTAAKKCFTKAEDLLEETKADKVLSRGKRVPFNHALLSVVLPLLERILREFDIMFLVLNNPGGGGLGRLAVGNSWGKNNGVLYHKLEITMQMLQKALEKKGVKRVSCKQLHDGEQHFDIDTSIGKNPASCVVERSIQNLFYLCDEIQAAVNHKGGLAVKPKKGGGLHTDDETKAIEEGTANAKANKTIDDEDETN